MLNYHYCKHGTTKVMAIFCIFRFPEQQPSARQCLTPRWMSEQQVYLTKFLGAPNLGPGNTWRTSPSSHERLTSPNPGKGDQATCHQELSAIHLALHTVYSAGCQSSPPKEKMRLGPSKRRPGMSMVAAGHTQSA